MSLFHLKPMRCKECRKRFYVTVPPDYPEKRRKQRKSPAEQADRVAADQRAA